MKNILILGGNGFLGFNLQKHLLSENNKITVLSRSKNLYFEELEKVNYIYDELKNWKLVDFQLSEFDIIIHSIGSANPLEDNLNPTNILNDSLFYTVEILENLINTKVHFIYISSGGAIYGNNSSNISENSTLSPINLYGHNKKIFESYIEYYSRNYDLKCSIIRPGNVYGPGQNFKKSQGIIAHSIYKSLNNQKIKVWGDGSFVRDYIFIDDLSYFLIALINSSKNGIYNVGTGQGQSVIEILSIIESEVKTACKKSFVDIPFNNVNKIILDVTKAKRELNWVPLIDIRNGIRLTCDWIKSIT